MNKVVLLVTLLSIFPQSAVPGQKFRKIVAILDTGLSLTDPRFTPYLCPGNLHKDFTGEGIEDTGGHGTHVAGLISNANNPQKFCIVVIKYYSYHRASQIRAYKKSLEYLRKLRPDIVNLSLDGPEFMEEEYLLPYENPKSLFFVAAGNENTNIGLTPTYPAELSKTFHNVIPVGAIDSYGHKIKSSNYGLKGMIWEQGKNIVSTIPDGKIGLMTGTSQATAIATGKYLHALK